MQATEQNRDQLMRDVERRLLAGLACKPSAIREIRASPDWFRDPQLQSMFVALSSLAHHDPSASAVAGQEIAAHCAASAVLAPLVVDDMQSGDLHQFSPGEFDLATEDGFNVVDNVESFARVLRNDARRREINDRLGEIAAARDPDEILAGLQGLLQDEHLAGDRGKRKPIIRSIRQLAIDHPTLRPEVVGGLLRQGETCNLIAAAKVGKSWMGYGLGLSVAAGMRWLGRFPCHPGKVLLIDNELHPELLASRIPAVANALGLRTEEYGERFDVLPLRGNLQPISALGSVIRGIQPGEYQMIVVDAMYRILPDGGSENDNSMMAGVYNLIDRYADQTGAAFVLVHHSSKGDQSHKSVTDTGAGAGAQSRAADSHLVIRPHEEDGAAVLDAALRSFAPIDPLAIRWEFPMWVPADDLDPDRLKRQPTRQELQQAERDKDAFDAIVSAIRTSGPATARSLRTATGFSREKLDRLLGLMQADGRLTAHQTDVRGNAAMEYDIADYLQNT